MSNQHRFVVLTSQQALKQQSGLLVYISERHQILHASSADVWCLKV